MMVEKVVAAGGGDSLELMVGKGAAEKAAGARQRVQENVIRIVHLIDPEHGFQAALVERGVMRHERKPFNEWLDFLPNIRKNRSVLRVLWTQAVDVLTEPSVVLRLRMDERVEPLHDLSPTDNYDSDAAYTAGTLVGRLEVYRRKISHRP